MSCGERAIPSWAPRARVNGLGDRARLAVLSRLGEYPSEHCSLSSERVSSALGLRGRDGQPSRGPPGESPGGLPAPMA